MQMNSYLGKQLLSLVRGSDYAHAGEEEAIELTLRTVSRRRDQLLLDVGCGRGGTAKYVQDHGWGKVVGLDSEPDSIARARQVYPGIEYHACHVADAGSVIGRQFDLIYLFNSFYAFADQPQALAVLARLAKVNGQLILFDYTDRGNYHDHPLTCDGDPFIPQPVRLSAIGDTLQQAGWELVEVEDLTAAYDRWYDALVRRMDGKRGQIIDAAGVEGFTFLRRQYVDLLGAIRGGSLGGAIIRAKRRTGQAPSCEVESVSRLVDFYRGEAADFEGRFLKDIWAWSDDELEAVHDYIQWLFPLPEPSRFNPNAPLLSEDDIAAFQKDKLLQSNLRKSFERILIFLGLTLAGDGQVVDGPNLSDRARYVWSYPNHNWLRITRILRSLRLLGLNAEALALYERLQAICSSKAFPIPSDTFQYWTEAAKGLPFHA